MAGRKRRSRQRLPLAWQGTDGHTSACGEVRSRLTGLLSRRNTASHRCLAGPDPGRSPSARSRKTGVPENVVFPHAPFSKRVEKRRGPTWAACRISSDDNFLRWHYPHQVEGRSRRFLSAITAPLYFSALLWHQRQGLSRPRFSKNVEKDRGSPLQCGKKRRMIETSEQRGVRIAGLRGDCHGLDLT